jgi:hypothetical protein
MFSDLIDTISNLLEVPDEPDVATINTRVEIFRKTLHDYIVRTCEDEISARGYLIVEDADSVLQPDVMIQDTQGHIILIEVTLSTDEEIISAKRAKYESLDPTCLVILTPLDSVSHYTGNRVHKAFQSCVTLLEERLRPYLRNVELTHGITHSDLQACSKLFSKVKTPQPVEWIQPDTVLSNDEYDEGAMLREIAEIMEDRDFAKKFHLEDSTQVCYEKLSENIMDDISSACKPSPPKQTFCCYFPPGPDVGPIVQEHSRKQTGRGDFWEQDLIMTQLSHIANSGTHFSGIVGQFFTKLGTEGLDVFKTGPGRKVLNYIPRKDDHKELIHFMSLSKTKMSTEQYVDEKLKRKAKSLAGLIRTSCVEALRHDDMTDMDCFENQLLQGDGEYIPQTVQDMLYDVGPDLPFFEALKEDMLDSFKEYIRILSRSNSLAWAFGMSEVMSQILHLQGLDKNYGDFSVFNNGRADILYFIRHSKMDKAFDTGKAYFYVVFRDLTLAEQRIHNLSSVCDIAGRHKFFVSKWSRIGSDRLAFHSDQPFSALATTFATYMRKSRDHSDSILGIHEKYARQGFISRCFVGMQHSQMYAEMVADLRYMFIHSISDYSSVTKFAYDKFSKPVMTCGEFHIVKKIRHFNRLVRARSEGGFREKGAVVVDGTRDRFTIGGYINCPSLYTEGSLTSLQDFLDEMFIYVHTNKEPSTIFHLAVEAVETITKFQNYFDALTPRQKLGEWDSMWELLGPNPVGFHKGCVAWSTSLLSKRLLKDSIPKKIDANLASLTLLDIVSTKSCIPELERKKVSVLARTTKGYRTDGAEQVPVKKFAKLKEASAHPQAFMLVVENKPAYVSGANRCKVHDSTIDLIQRLGVYTVYDLAKWNILVNKARVTSDICIKAQYGAKREFYVINHGAKACAKVVEEGYRQIAQCLESEMISVPGDEKMIRIQQLVDKTCIAQAGTDLKTFYINGDCTKWSAAETMECFRCMNRNLPPTVLSTEQKYFFDRVFCAWQNKTITIPTLLNKNLYYEGSNKVGETEMKSSQNFLQGVFNNVSSVKAVACANLAEHIWRRLYPERHMVISHLEHSDDYAFVCLCKDSETFLKFKALHRLVMRLHGISDSEKKTNCHSIFLEFVSLVSFNGVMTYPEIKTVKEVGLNIGCDGFPADIKTSTSRVSNACRMGVPHVVAYAMLRIQNIRIARAYGLLTTNRGVYPGGFGTSATSLPIELFGVPDMHPAVVTLSGTDGNNWRLYKYGSVSCRDLIVLLYNLRTHEVRASESIDDDAFISDDLYHPNYEHMKESKALQKIKQCCGVTHEKAQKYFEDHPSDMFVKPVEKDRQMLWLKCKYYLRSFVSAYMKQTRSRLVVKLAGFVKGDCLFGHWKESAPSFIRDAFDSGKTSIGEYFSSVIDTLEAGSIGLVGSEDLFLSTLLQYNTTIPVMYDSLTSVRYTIKDCERVEPRCYHKPPIVVDYPVTESPTVLAQYIVCPKDFEKDSRSFRNVYESTKTARVMKELARKLGLKGKKNLAKMVVSVCKVVAKGKPILLTRPPGDVVQTLITCLKDSTQYGKYVAMDMGVAPEFQIRRSYNLTFTKVKVEATSIDTASAIDDLAAVMFYFDKIVDTSLFDEDYNIFDFYVVDRILGTKMPVEKYLNFVVQAYLTGQIKLSNTREKLLGFMEMRYLEDSRVLHKYLHNHTSYTYKYVQSGREGRQTIVYYKYMGETFRLEFDEVEDRPARRQSMKVYFKHGKLDLLGYAYPIALKLASLVGGAHFLNLMTNPAVKNIPQSCQHKKAGIAQVYKSNLGNTVTMAPNPRTDTPTMFYYTEESVEMPGVSTQGQASTGFTMDLINYEIKNGGARLYMLPFFDIRTTGLVDTCALHKTDMWWCPDQLLKDDGLGSIISRGDYTNVDVLRSINTHNIKSKPPAFKLGNLVDTKDFIYEKSDDTKEEEKPKPAGVGEQRGNGDVTLSEAESDALLGGSYSGFVPIIDEDMEMDHVPDFVEGQTTSAPQYEESEKIEYIETQESRAVDAFEMSGNLDTFKPSTIIKNTKMVGVPFSVSRFMDNVSDFNQKCLQSYVRHAKDYPVQNIILQYQLSKLPDTTGKDEPACVVRTHLIKLLKKVTKPNYSLSRLEGSTYFSTNSTGKVSLYKRIECEGMQPEIMLRLIEAQRGGIFDRVEKGKQVLYVKFRKLDKITELVFDKFKNLVPEDLLTKYTWFQEKMDDVNAAFDI